eukprot:30017-Pelagococcus_subviridis.AAC.25
MSLVRSSEQKVERYRRRERADVVPAPRGDVNELPGADDDVHVRRVREQGELGQVRALDVHPRDVALCVAIAPPARHRRRAVFVLAAAAAAPVFVRRRVFPPVLSLSLLLLLLLRARPRAVLRPRPRVTIHERAVALRVQPNELIPGHLPE